MGGCESKDDVKEPVATDDKNTILQLLGHDGT